MYSRIHKTAANRLKVFEIARDQARIDKIHTRVKMCREFMNGLNLEGHKVGLIENLPF